MVLMKAEILAKVQTKPLGVKPESASSSADATSGRPEFTPANLLADARKFAAGDTVMLAWADKVEKSLAAKTRGAAGGPREGIDFVSAGGSV
jgi:hypothetical protein